VGLRSDRLLWHVLRAVTPAFLWWRGWRIEGRPPEGAKLVIVAAPHTSNWDYAYTLAAGLTWGIPFRFLAKDSIFRGPLGWFFRGLGGVPVDRARLNNLLPWSIEQFEEREQFVLVVAPEATRARTEHWQPGFYWIALGARVPIALGYADYARKVSGVGPILMPSGDVEADMAIIAEFYAGVAARFPDQVGPIRLASRRQRTPRQ
jgi:1-acyl-sn-glycerol-3-phosphate acyltransferase